MGRNDNTAFKAEEANDSHTALPANDPVDPATFGKTGAPANDPVDPAAFGKISSDNTAAGLAAQEGIDNQPVQTSAASKIKGAAANAAAAAGHAVNVASESLQYRTGTLKGAAANATATVGHAVNSAAEALHYHTGTLSAVDLLINQHREAATVLDKALATEDPASRFRLVEKVTDALLIHMRLEEELFYPTAAAECPGEQKFVEQSKDEHSEAKELIAKLLRMDPADGSFRSILQELTDDIKEHVEKEESDLLPTAKKSMSADSLKKLGEQMHERHGKLEKLKKPRDMAFRDTDTKKSDSTK